MCPTCAMAAVGGASGIRAWLNAHSPAWLTPRRLRAVTITLCVGALGASTVSLGGTASAPERAPEGHDAAR